MTTVTTWTGWEANALRKALRMSVTDFAEHLGAARRTVAKWSSRGRDVQLRTEMQAALDTVLARASAEVRERFEQLRVAGTGGAPATAVQDLSVAERSHANTFDYLRSMGAGTSEEASESRLLGVLATVPPSPAW